jgi:hypothetical protein
MMDLAVGLNFTDDAPHRLLTVRPQSLKREGRTTSKANIATCYLLAFVVRALAALDKAHQVQFFSMISSHPWLKGWCFEKFVHVRLIAHPPLKPLRATPAKQDSGSLDIPVCNQFNPLGGVTLLKKANTYSLPFYWQPTSGSFTSLNAIICTAQDIILIQTTVSLTHDVKPEGLDAVLGNLPLKFRQACRICLVFVTDNKIAAEHLRNQKLSKLSSYLLKIYSSVFSVGQTPWSETEKQALKNIVVSNDSMFTFALLNMPCLGQGFRTGRNP